MLSVGRLAAFRPESSQLHVSVVFRGKKKRTSLSEEDKNVKWNENMLSFEIFYEPFVDKKEKMEGKVGRPEREDITDIPRFQELPLRSQSPSPESGSVKGTAKLMRKLSDKPQDFQVRVRIIEGRQLQGTNIRPVVKVYVGDTVFRTRIKRGNNPVFDEIFFQNFHKLPSEVFNTLIHLQVLNSHSLRADSMIGVFKLDIGSVYDLPGHAVLRKWLLLYEPDDVHALAKGYLKVSIIVLAAGDEAPIDKRGTNEEDDVESNLLQPAGILSRWVTFELRIYRAEDISHIAKGFVSNLKHMFGVDSDKQDGIDSFLEVSFAGNKIATKVIENHINPEWNQVIYLQSRSEGVSYRGRILIELITRMDENLGKSIDSLSSEDYLIVQKYLQRRRYSLCVVFYSATQMQDVKEPIQFEVSVGNYGNKFDKSCKLHASTTQYSQAMFDGNYYYYLPWCDTKPVVALTSYWENIDHRLDRLNILLKIIDKLRINIEDIRTTLPSEGTRLTGMWVKMLDRIVKDCSRSLPQLKRLPQVTVLDQHMHEQQTALLKKIRKSAEKLRDKNVSVEDKLPEVEEWFERLSSVAEEPQNSLPDVILWMLSGEKRVAYSRIKAHSVLFSRDSEKSCGKFCGKLQTVFMKQPLDRSQDMRSVAQLRVRMWMGLSSDEEEFEKYIDGKILVAAERYENQAKVMGHWGTSGLLQHPTFSDAMGKIRLSKKDFYPLKGWQWDGKWTIDPERCLLFGADAGHNEYTDDVFENETYLAGGEWSPALEQYTDIKGNRHIPMEDIECPVGWEWKEEWSLDFYRAVDEQGWEYGKAVPPDNTPKHWNPTEKAYHTHRRRRWIRKRTRKPDRQRQVKREEFDPEGWEYAPLFGWKFHVKPSKGDTYRRRRWRRRMIPRDQLGPAAIFRLEGSLCRENSNEQLDDLEQQEKTLGHQDLYGMTAPFVSCILDPPNAFQFRGYIYQARGLVPTDSSSSADPYIQVSFLYQSKHTEVIKGTVNPTWDQTLIFEEIEIYGSLREIVEIPPFVLLELFDSNRASKHEYMGAALCYPSVKLDSTTQYVSVLQWHPVFQGQRFSGELLVSFELLMKQRDEDQNLPPRPPMKDSETYMVPLGVRPQLQMTTIEILAWGLRNIKNYNMLRVTSPSLVVECSGEMIQTAPIKNYKKNPNFLIPIYFITVFLPVDASYSPPIVLKVLDFRAFGYKPVVGQTTVKSLSQFMCDPFAGLAEAEDANMTSTKSFNVEAPNIESSAAEDERKSDLEATEGQLEDNAIDWWCKFYASSGEHDYTDYLLQGYDTIKIYPCPLEDVPHFKGLQDFCHTFKLYRGKVYGDIEDPIVVGEFKGSFRIYPLPEDPTKPLPPSQFRQLPSSEPQICLVRVYIVRALSLQPKDRSGTCDPYIKISLGKVFIDDHEHFIANTLNPVFGKMFQLYATIPLNKDLKVAVYDYDLISQDDKIGETVVDLENRFLSRFGARCGLPRTYCIAGSTQWRDQLTPLELLNNLCSMKNYALPVARSNGQKISIGEREFLLGDFEAKKIPYSSPGPPEERLALHVLHLQNLVPEHVETRTLFNSTQPGIEQGKLQMWIDIFPKKLGAPGPPFDITPRAPIRYVLRCIIWNTNDVILQEANIMGERMSDIYIKGWMVGLEEQKQNTDVHYRSLDGEGNFNWRFIFQFEYLTMERVLIVNKRNYIWSLDETEMKMPPKLILQVWDNDKVSFDDYLGYLEINLNAFRCPAKWADRCTLEKFFKLEDSSSDSLQKMISLFKQKSIKGWWPCVTYEDGKPFLTGKLELTLELLTEREAEERPAGKGRDEPNMNPKLEPPNRPDTSFLWFRSPFKAMKHIVWRKYRWWVICAVLLVVPVIFLVALLHAIPNVLANFLLQSTRFHRKKK
ncbi:myoferlin-like [Cetorhinus maximus]